MVADLTAALPQITDQFFAAIELRACRLVTIEVAYQTNPERDVVEIIAVDVATVDLASPTIADFDLAVAGRSAVANHEMISEPVLHPADMSMIIVERGGVALPRATIVYDDVLPTALRHRCAVDLIAHRCGEITVTRAARSAPIAAAEKSRPKSFRFLVTVFLDR